MCGSQVIQLGEQPELRGQAAAHIAAIVVGLEGPAREGRRSGIMGERRWTQRAASATRALPLCPPRALRVPSRPLPCHGLEVGVLKCGGTQRWYTTGMGAQRGAAVGAVADFRLARANGVGSVGAPQPRCQYQQQRGAPGATRHPLLVSHRQRAEVRVPAQVSIAAEVRWQHRLGWQFRLGAAGVGPSGCQPHI